MAFGDVDRRARVFGGAVPKRTVQIGLEEDDDSAQVFAILRMHRVSCSSKWATEKERGEERQERAAHKSSADVGRGVSIACLPFVQCVALSSLCPCVCVCVYVFQVQG